MDTQNNNQNSTLPGQSQPQVDQSNFKKDQGPIIPNQVIPQTTIVNPPPAAPVSPPPQIPTLSQRPKQPANFPKKLFFMILSLFILLFLAGLLILLTNPRSSSSKGRTDFSILTPKPPKPSSTPALSEEEQELETVDVGSLEPDFQDLEADLQQL